MQVGKTRRNFYEAKWQRFNTIKSRLSGLASCGHRDCSVRLPIPTHEDCRCIIRILVFVNDDIMLCNNNNNIYLWFFSGPDRKGLLYAVKSKTKWKKFPSAFPVRFSSWGSRAIVLSYLWTQYDDIYVHISYLALKILFDKC